MNPLLTDPFSGTTLIDAVIALTLLEWLALYVCFRVTGKGLAPHHYTLNLVAGLFLMLALRSAVANGAGWGMALLLACAGLAHAADLYRRWKAPAT